MAATVVQLISRKIIKPSSPTPSSLKSYKLTFMDKLSRGLYMPLASFYSNQHPNDSLDNTTQISQLLERSLSKLLNFYYPMAGTLIDNVSIDCNDSGVTLIETRINSSMAEILQEPDNSSAINIVYPTEYLPWSHLDKDNLVVIQLNHFECGGIAIAMCMTHKLGDGSTLGCFMSDWAALARDSEHEPSPQFIGPSILPREDLPTIKIYDIPEHEPIGKRFTFRGQKIAQLKKLMAEESGVENPTRVEVVTAFLFKSVMNSSQSFSPSILFQMVNVRRLTEPPLADNSVGNIYSLFSTTIVDERDMKLSRLVSEIRRSKVEFYEKCKRMNLDELIVEGLQNWQDQKQFAFLQGMEFLFCTSLCGFPLNNLDFGWGRPVKAFLETVPIGSGFVLMDDINGDGIDAIVTLDEKIMSILESDEELLAFAST